MNFSSSKAYFFAAAVVAAPLLAGCSVKVEGESAVLYEGSPEQTSVAYTAGQNIRISGDNGSIDVAQGSGSEVSVTFYPSILDAQDNEDNARKHMENNLVFTASGEGDTLVIAADKKDGSSANLAADIKVTLPAGFDGTFELVQGNGSTDVDISGGNPTNVDIYSDNGSVDVWMGGFAPGNITLDGAGDLYLNIPGSINGVIDVVLDGGSVSDLVHNAPSDWVQEDTTDGAMFTAGDGTGGTLTLFSGFDVDLDVN